MSVGFEVRHTPNNNVLKRWGIDITELGYTALPNHLVYANQFLDGDMKLSPSEFWVLSVILSCWRDAHVPPSPSKGYIAERIGLSERQVQRNLGKLQHKGFIRRHEGDARSRGANRYYLDGTVRFLRYMAAMREKYKKQQISSIPKIRNMIVDTPPIPGYEYVDEGRELPDDRIPF